MNRPFFTIAIPTKNRPDRLAAAIKSVLTQTFSDFELAVSDNCDEAESEKTAAVVRSFNDARIRYIRTSGHLSMPDNWERACEDARGEFVGILTDRSVFRRDALQVVHDEIQTTGARVVGWFCDSYGRDPEGKKYRRRGVSLARHRLESAAVLDYFLRGHPKYAGKVLPKLLGSVCHRSILDAILASPIGRCCPPVCPDYTSGFLMLAHSEWFLLIDDALFVTCGVGNGSSFRRRGPLAERFKRDLGMTWKELVDRMPSEACFSHALVLNDFKRLKDAMPVAFERFEIDHPQYYLGCLYDYWKSARHGVDRSEDLDALIEGLNFEPDEVQKAVRDQQVYIRAVITVPAVSGDGVDPEVAEGEQADVDGGRFETVFEALDWNERHPRAPLARSVQDMMPGLNVMKRRRDVKPSQMESPRAFQ